jgi:hypothetical protein
MSSIMAAATAILFSFADPSGDSFGDGSYQLPRRADPLQLDLRTLTGSSLAGRLVLRITLGRIQNPQRFPFGISQPVIDVFLGSGSGGTTTLGDSGLRTPNHRGWHHHLRVTPFEARLNRNTASTMRPGGGRLELRVDGSTLEIKTPLPADGVRYTVWAMVSLYDPLEPNAVARPRSEAIRNPLRLVVSRPDAPSVVDILSSEATEVVYRSRIVPPLNEPVYQGQVLLITALVGAVIALGATVLGWKTQGRR